MRRLLVVLLAGVALTASALPAQAADQTLDIEQARSACLREATFMRIYHFGSWSGFAQFHRVSRTRAFCVPWTISKRIPLPDCHANCHLGRQYCVRYLKGMFFRSHGAIMAVVRTGTKSKVVPCPGP